jgi:dihydroflavonol-4-reductase
MRGCDWCFHVAASYHLWLRDYAPMYAANVEGTRHVIQAAAAAGCRRIVYTSTVGCIGLPRESGGKIIPTDEDAPVSAAQISNHYKRSKWQAEEVARQLAAQGAPVVIVNPSAPVGPRDVKPTPTGKIILDFLNRKLPGYVDTGLNWVHVRDVAAGHILAAEKGRLGERYILGSAQGNWTMRETLAVLEELSGVPAPEMARALRGGAAGRIRQRGALRPHRPGTQSAAGRSAHGEIQDVFQSRQGDPRIGPAANPAAPGLRRRHRVVPQGK